MTRLVCVCGAVIEGSEEELLEAVERHVTQAHAAQSLGYTTRPADPAEGKAERRGRTISAEDDTEDER